MTRYGARRRWAPYSRIVYGPGVAEFSSSYDPVLVQRFKAEIPSKSRRWDPAGKVWIIEQGFVDLVVDLVEDVLGIDTEIRGDPDPDQGEQVEMLEVRYIGSAKPRADWGDAEVAFGHDGKGWNVALPAEVMKKWFCIPSGPAVAITLYGELGVDPKAGAGEIKKAYRRLARQWHPDVSKEPDAPEVFKRINGAYHILSNETTRRKYDAGLALEASLKPNQRLFDVVSYGWRSPLRCGWILAKGERQLGRFVVSEILEWQDIVDGRGRTLVTSWQQGDDTYTESWIR